MDGFYVAKIIKLSDRRPEDTLDEEVPDGEGMAETMNPKTMSTTQRRKARGEAAAKTAGGDINTKKKKKTKKIIRKRKPGDDGEDDNAAAKEKNKSKHSVPPVQIQSKNKKQKTNAKVTKPRRKKAAADA